MTKIANNIGELGVETVTIAGGEPFLRTDLFEILGILNDYSVKTVVLTNGALINDKIIKKLIACSVAGVRVSVHFSLPESLDRSNGNSRFFNRIDHTIKRLVDNKINTGINLTLLQENIKEIGPIMDYAIKSKCSFVRFLPFLNIGKAKNLPNMPDFYSKTEKRLVLKTMGVLPEYQKLGIGSALFYLVYRRAKEENISKFIFSTMRQDNVGIKELTAHAKDVYRKYAVYELNL